MLLFFFLFVFILFFFVFIIFFNLFFLLVLQVNGSAYTRSSLPNGVSVNGSSSSDPLKHRSNSETKLNGVYTATAATATGTGTGGRHDRVVVGKPEKPERKLNNKELIEKQRNWTSHFSKSKTSGSSSLIAKRYVYSKARSADTFFFFFSLLIFIGRIVAEMKAAVAALNVNRLRQREPPLWQRRKMFAHFLTLPKNIPYCHKRRCRRLSLMAAKWKGKCHTCIKVKLDYTQRIGLVWDSSKRD